MMALVPLYITAVIMPLARGLSDTPRPPAFSIDIRISCPLEWEEECRRIGDRARDDARRVVAHAKSRG
jgi:hypothetical protein